MHSHRLFFFLRVQNSRCYRPQGLARNTLRAGVDFYLCSQDSTSLMDIRWTNILRLSETLMYENIVLGHHSKQRQRDAITLDWFALAAPPHVLAVELIIAFVVAARKGNAVTMSPVAPLSSFSAKCRYVRGAVEHDGFVPLLISRPKHKTVQT